MTFIDTLGRKFIDRFNATSLWISHTILSRANIEQRVKVDYDFKNAKNCSMQIVNLLCNYFVGSFCFYSNRRGTL